MTPDTGMTEPPNIVETNQTAPDLDRVLNAISDGEYDEEILKIQEAFLNRRKVLQEKLLERVREVFGPDADVVIKTSTPSATKNPFVAKSQSQVIDSSSFSLPGPHKTNPNDGNSYRVMEDFGNGMISITDIFGGHEHSVTKSEWDTWSDVSIDDAQDIPLPQNHSNVDSSFEHRGPVIGGLSTVNIPD